MQIPLTRAATLNLIARIHNVRNWEAMHAVLQAAEKQSLSRQTLEHSESEARTYWLQWVEAAFRMQGYHEEHLDDLVYDVMAAEEASSANNQGVLSQLTALLEYQEGDRRSNANPRVGLLKVLLQVLPQFRLPMPEAQPQQYSAVFIPAKVSVCEGSSSEHTIDVDVLEWFACASHADVRRLLRDGLANTGASDEVVLWLAESSQDGALRSRIDALLSYCRQAQHLRPDLVGLTVRIDEHAVMKFMEAMSIEP